MLAHVNSVLLLIDPDNVMGGADAPHATHAATTAATSTASTNGAGGASSSGPPAPGASLRSAPLTTGELLKLVLPAAPPAVDPAAAAAGAGGGPAGKAGAGGKSDAKGGKAAPSSASKDQKQQAAAAAALAEAPTLPPPLQQPAALALVTGPAATAHTVAGKGIGASWTIMTGQHGVPPAPTVGRALSELPPRLVPLPTADSRMVAGSAFVYLGSRPLARVLLPNQLCGLPLANCVSAVVLHAAWDRDEGLGGEATVSPGPGDIDPSDPWLTSLLLTVNGVQQTLVSSLPLTPYQAELAYARMVASAERSTTIAPAQVLCGAPAAVSGGGGAAGTLTGAADSEAEGEGRAYIEKARVAHAMQVYGSPQAGIWCGNGPDGDTTASGDAQAAAAVGRAS